MLQPLLPFHFVSCTHNTSTFLLCIMSSRALPLPVIVPTFRIATLSPTLLTFLFSLCVLARFPPQLQTYQTIRAVNFLRLCEIILSFFMSLFFRFKEERPRHPVHCDYIQTVAQAVSIPVIANGGSLDLVKTNGDIENFRKATGASSVMLARAAMWNASVFSSNGPVLVEKVMEEYLKYAIRYDNHAFNTKYCLCQMLRDKVESPLGKQVQAAQTNADISEAFGLQEFYQQTQDQLQARRDTVQKDSQPNRPVMDGDVITMAVKFERRHYPPQITPKMFLLEWSRKEKLEQPQYETVQRSQDRAFQSTVTVAKKKYRSSLWEKSKKFAEQASAIVCLRVLGIPEGRIGEEDSGLVCKRKREERPEGRSKKLHVTNILQEVETSEPSVGWNGLRDHQEEVW
uniref:Dihydrouridine synthase 2 n=1 Tax=Kryptolebias marmoratus TaxID=37003 RepID=A0A3Q3AKV1_KRYMA